MCNDIRVISVFIMKVSKIFGCVLGLHFGVIAVLLIQPGCRTKQPPTQTYTQDRTTDGFIPATGVAPGDGLDAAFNAGFEDGRPAVDSAANEFSEFDNVAPLTPLTSGGQSVQVAGPSFEAYIVKKGDNLWSIAKRYNVSLNELYTANGLNKNSVLRIGQQIQVPVEGSTASISTVSADTYQPTSFNQGSTSYTVKRGDTLSKVANQYDTSVRAIKAANSMTSDLIRVGETLVIPVGANANTSGALGTSGTSLGTSAASAAPSSTVTTSGSRTHTVKPGEYPATIARQYGMPTGELLALNGITDPRKLQVGQVLKINGSGSAANVASRTETVVTPAPAPVSPAPRVPVTSSGPVEIRVIEADPLVEGEATEIQTDEVFDSAVEIPVIRLEESASSASSSPL